MVIYNTGRFLDSPLYCQLFVTLTRLRLSRHDYSYMVGKIGPRATLDQMTSRHATDLSLSGTVSRLHKAIAASRRSLLRAQCLARILDPTIRKHPALRQVLLHPYRSAGSCHHIETPFLMRRARYTFERNAPPHAGDKKKCPFCPPNAYEHKNPARQLRIRVQYLRAHRIKYKNKVSRKHEQIRLSSNRISAARADLNRLEAQTKCVNSGEHNKESSFMNKRQNAETLRDNMIFRTSSIHAYGQSLNIYEARPALEFELETAERDLEKFSKELDDLLNSDPLVLHHIYALVRWWKSYLRRKIGREALWNFKRRVARAHTSEQRYWYLLRQRLAAATIQNAWRCYVARCQLWNLKMKWWHRAATTIQNAWRHLRHIKRLRILRRICCRLLQMGRDKMLHAFKNKWWKWVEDERRLEWLQRFVRKTRFHYAAIRIQKKTRFYLRLGREKLMQHVVSKAHFTVRRQMFTPSKKKTICAKGANMTRWDLQRLIMDLEELQSRTTRILNHGQQFFAELHAQNRRFHKLYQLYSSGQRAPVPRSWTEKFRGIGEKARPSSDLPPSCFVWPGWSATRFPESFEWMVLQRIDRKFRANQLVVDAVTSMFDRYGEKLDTKDHHMVAQMYLRSLDPMQVHDAEITREISKSQFFAWHFPHVALCRKCSCMLVKEYQACSNCGKERHTQRKISMTYSMILQEPAHQLSQEQIQKSRQHIDVDKARAAKRKSRFDAFMLAEISTTEVKEAEVVLGKAKCTSWYQKTESRRMRREKLPDSVLDIHQPSEPFIFHAHFWATSPKRYGKGRVTLHKSKFWDAAVFNAKKDTWLKTLVQSHGVSTIGKLSLWSKERLVDVAGVPHKTATRIVQLMGIFKKELGAKSWRDLR